MARAGGGRSAPQAKRNPAYGRLAAPVSRAAANGRAASSAPDRVVPILPPVSRPSRMPAATTALVSLSDVLTALSHALDLSAGQPEGHTLRSCLVAGRLAQELGLGDDDRAALHYAVLLKDAGCSSNASRFAALFGSDDRVVKPLMKEVDWQRRARVALRVVRAVGIGRPLRERVHHFLGIARSADVTRTLIAVRCDRGAEIARSIGFPDATADAIRALDEHWNGGGYPEGLRGDAIPRLAQIALLAQTAEAFHASHGVAGAMRAVRARRGTWFDPRLADRVLGWKRDRAWWAALGTPAAAAAIAQLEPADRVRQVDDEGLTLVARAFAEVIDAKSPYTYRHSANVAEYAAGIAAECGLPAAEQRRLRQAGLLHDVGKLGVSNRILDSPARLGPEERAQVERHPLYTWEILRRVRAFAGFAWTASTHHEKIDGSGYPWRLAEPKLDLPARVLVVADIYEALTADRPYRAGMPHAAAMDIIARDRGTKLDARAVDALDAWVGRGRHPVALAA